MKIVSFFTNSGAPATGLNPTIRIRDLSDNSLIVTDGAMTEVGDGHYVYDFTDYDIEKDYAIRSDGGGTLPTAERYKYAGNENYLDDTTFAVDSSRTSTRVLAVSASIDSIQNDVTNIQNDITSL